MNSLADILCDACLHLMETSPHGVPLLDFCKRCQKKMATLCVEIPAEEFEGDKQ